MLLCFILLTVLHQADAQSAGTLDSTFGTNGVSSVQFPNGGARGGGVRQPDGKLIVVGFAGTSDLDFGITRFTENGILDSTFGTNGKTIVNIQLTDIPYACALQSDGKLIVAGTSSPSGGAGSYDFCAIRLKTDGTVDSTFGTNGRAILSYSLSNQANAVLVQPDGKILLAGTSDYAANQGVQMPLMTRLTSSGQVDATFGNSGWVKNTESADLGYWVWIYAIALNSDGKIYIGGTTTSTGFGTTFAIYRYNANGSIDNGFVWYNTRYSDGLNAGGIAYALAVQQDGKVIAAGTTHNDFYVCRFSTNGSIDGSFGGSLGKAVSLTSSNSDYIYACIVQDDGKILVAGSADANLGLARFNTNGTLDNTFGTNGTTVTDLGAYDDAYGLAVTPSEGKILVFGGKGENFIAARYYGYTQTNPAPTIQSSAVTAVLATQTTATVRWTKGNGSGRILFARVDNPVSFSPVNGQTFTANSTYGSGTSLGSSTYPVYDGTDSVVTIQGLVIGKTYYFSAMEYNGSGNSKTYLQTNPATGSYTVSPLAGYDGSSYVVKFDGSNDHIYNSTISQGNGPFTVEAWVYFSSSNLASAGVFNRAGNTTANIIWKFNMHNEFMRIDFYSTNVLTNTQPLGKTVIGTAVVKDDKWHHIAGGYDGSDIFLYVDGNLQGRVSYAGLTLNTSSVPLVIGYDSCCGGRPFNGMIAELRIWNSARTQQEIRDNMHKRIPKDNASMLAYYHFDDANGTTTYDSVSATSATLLNFNYNSNSGFIKSNPPFGPEGTYVASSGAETSVGTAGAQLHATTTSIVDSINTIGLYSFGAAGSYVSDVSVLIADVRSQLTWGIQKKGTVTDTTQIVFDYSGTGITSGYAKLLSRASAAASWTDVSGQFTHDTANRKFSKTGSTSSAEYSIGTSNDDPLPVEAGSLTVEVNRMDVELQWRTETEVNNYGFEVQRSEAGVQSPEWNWHTVGFVEGSGTTNASTRYSFTDKSLNAGKYSYRLKQIDRSGSYSYSQVIEVMVGTIPRVFALAQNFPNPFNPNTTIRFTLQETGRTTLKIYDAVGREVAQLADEVLEAGVYHQRVFDGARLASGVYFARLTSGGQMQMKKLLLMK
jgi:uncharacterized delta-60 repeat protein